MRAVIVAILLVSACTVPEVDLDGRPCPCVDGYVCDDATNTCVADGEPGDAGVDIGADTSAMDTSTPDTTVSDTSVPTDTGPGDAPPVDTGPDVGVGCFHDDFDATGLPGWSIEAGDWSQRGGEATQGDSSANLAFMYAEATDGMRNFRATARMRQLTGAFGGALEITFRTNTADPLEQYFCNWEPNNAQMVLMRGDPTDGTRSLNDLDLDLERTPGWDALASFTMVLEVDGADFRCWVEEVPGTEITARDTRYRAGAVGLKTYQMSGAYDYLTVCPLP